MPSELTHIIQARRFLRVHPEYDEAEFLSGTVFPDIRLLEVIDRARTHPGQPKLEDVLAERDSWRAGFTFHKYLDLAWDQWIRSYHVDPKYDVWKPFSNALKLLLDEVLYEHKLEFEDLALEVWPVRAHELAFGLEERDVKLWHGIIAGYLVAGPTHAALRKLLLLQHNPKPWIDEVMGYLGYVEATPLWAERVKEFADGVPV